MSDTLTLLLVLNKIWKRLEELPKERMKIVVIDEAWLMSKMPGAMDRVESIARMGRKMNIKFVFISQNVDDIAKDRGAETKLVDNIATKIIMRLETQAMKNAKDVLNMTDAETDMLTQFSPGQGMIFTERQRVSAQFEATREETLNYFDTSAAN